MENANAIWAWFQSFCTLAKKYQATLSGKAIVGAVTLQHSDIVAGVVTATSYKGSGADLTGLPAGFSWIEGNPF